MIEPILALLQMQVEGAIGNSIELLKPALSVTPETLNAVDMMCALHKLITPMMDSEVLRVSDIDQTVIAAPSIGVDDGSKRNATANNGLQSGFAAVGHDFSVNASIALEDAEDDCFARCASASFAAHASSAEVRLINLDFAGSKGRGALTFLCDAFSDFEKDRSQAAARQPSQLSCMTGRQIEREVAHYLTEFTLSNFRPPVIAV